MPEPSERPRKRPPVKVTLHKQVLARAKALAKKRDISLSEMVEILLIKELEHNSASPYDPLGDKEGGEPTSEIDGAGPAAALSA